MSASERPWQPVVLPDLPPPKGAYSPAVRAGNLLFVAGQTPRDPATGQVIGNGVEEQTRIVLANLARVLDAAGASLANVVALTIYLDDMENWGAFDQVYRTVFTPPFPTRTVVGAILPGLTVEVTATAWVE